MQFDEWEIRFGKIMCLLLQGDITSHVVMGREIKDGTNESGLSILWNSALGARG
jgi:hypothetical protein